MAPQYKLIYFNSRGFAEITRLCFAAADVEYEDIRNTQETFRAEYKEKTPFKHAPCLEVDGVTLSESSTLFRYVARNHGLDGKTPIECGQADMIAEVFLDLKGPLTQWYREDSQEKKEEIAKKIREETLPGMFDNLEKYLEGKDFFVGNYLTYCDLVAYEAVGGWVRRIDPDLKCLEGRALLTAHRQRVENLPRIKAWLEKRPQTDN